MDVRASKWVQNGPQAQKQLQILKAHTFTFPMTYSKSGYENIDFMTFFNVRALKRLQNGPESKKITSFQLSNDIYHVRI